MVLSAGAWPARRTRRLDARSGLASLWRGRCIDGVLPCPANWYDRL